MTLAALDAIDVRWSEEILEELVRNVVAKNPDIDRVRFEQHTVAAMRRHFPNAVVPVDPEVATTSLSGARWGRGFSTSLAGLLAARPGRPVLGPASATLLKYGSTLVVGGSDAVSKDGVT